MHTHNTVQTHNIKHTTMGSAIRISNERIFQFILMAIFIVTVTAIHAEQKSLEITVYKSPTCGCCNAWIAHLEKNGFKVTAQNRNDMPMIKGAIGVNSQFQSCHTAVVDGYFIEGHVSANDIKRLLRDKPNAAGLSVPGMPMGSPGMEGPRKDPYTVLLINKDGSTKEYSKH